MKTRMTARIVIGASAALLGLMIAPVFTASAASAAPAGHRGTYNCTGGDVPPGTYQSMIITGVCYMPAGNVVIKRDLTIAPGALLDAVTPGDPAGKPVVPATVVVRGGVFVGRGAVLLFGCSPNISCSSPPGISFDRIGGRLTAIGAQAVVVHSAAIGGSATLLGGGGGAAAATCNAQAPGKPIIADLKPWSEDPNLDQTPVYSDFEDSSIGGSLTIAGLTSCWLGSLRDQVRGNASFIGNTMGDPDAMEVHNLVGGNLTCRDNTPAVQFGDSGAAPSIVGGRASGQCGFQVIVPNPAPAPGQPAGIQMHIAVSARSLKTYYGTHTMRNVTSLPPVKTEAGDMILADLNDFAITGTGLTGSGTFDPSKPPGSTGEAVLATVYPDGSASFTAFDTCNCRFGGKTGMIMIRAYGRTSRDGVTTGTFLVVSGGSGHGGLSTLAGWGTFSSDGRPAGTLRLVEHLRIT